MEIYTPTFKIIANTRQEADEIESLFSNMMNLMPVKDLLVAARKVEKDPQAKVRKMKNYIILL